MNDHKRRAMISNVKTAVDRLISQLTLAAFEKERSVILKMNMIEEFLFFRTCSFDYFELFLGVGYGIRTGINVYAAEIALAADIHVLSAIKIVLMTHKVPTSALLAMAEQIKTNKTEEKFSLIVMHEFKVLSGAIVELLKDNNAGEYDEQ